MSGVIRWPWPELGNARTERDLAQGADLKECSRRYHGGCSHESVEARQKQRYLPEEREKLNNGAEEARSGLSFQNFLGLKHKL